MSLGSPDFAPKGCWLLRHKEWKPDNELKVFSNSRPGAETTAAAFCFVCARCNSNISVTDMVTQVFPGHPRTTLEEILRRIINS